MNLILLDPKDFIHNTTVRLEDRRFRHIRDVLRAKEGDELAIGKLNGPMGAGTVTAIDESFVELEVRLDKTPPDKLPLTLILALPRPKVIRRVLRAVSAMGVKRLILLGCARVEKSFWQSPFLSDENIRQQFLLGLEQARDTVLPEVLLRKLFKPFVEDELPAVASGTLPLLAHPAAEAPCPRDAKQAVTLAIGPEGGFIPYEIEKLAACGFRPVQLGERILSVETAVPALIARLF